MTKENEMEQQAELPVFALAEMQPLLQAAIEKGPDGVEALERLVSLHERAQERQAARAFHEAMRQFASEVDPIPKLQRVGKPNRDGSTFGYSYAALEDIARVIKEPLQRAGLAYTWDSVVNEGQMTVTCTVRHIEGHSESARFTCPTTASGAMSDQQKNGAALTYARRQSLVQALGLTMCEEDTDAADPEAFEHITEEQVATLEDWIDKVEANRKGFLDWLKVDSLADLPKSRYKAAVQALKDKEKRKGERG